MARSVMALLLLSFIAITIARNYIAAAAAAAAAAAVDHYSEKRDER